MSLLKLSGRTQLWTRVRDMRMMASLPTAVAAGRAESGDLEDHRHHSVRRPAMSEAYGHGAGCFSLYRRVPEGYFGHTQAACMRSVNLLTLRLHGKTLCLLLAATSAHHGTADAAGICMKLNRSL